MRTWTDAACPTPAAAMNLATAGLATDMAKTRSSTLVAKRRSGRAQKKNDTRAETQEAEKHGAADGSMTQMVPGDERTGKETGSNTMPE